MLYTCPTIYEKPASTKDAMLKSIAKWETIVQKLKEGYMIDGYTSESCALCKLFGASCSGCPVSEKTNKIQCRETPFYTFTGLKTAETAQAEVDFLKQVAKEQGLLGPQTPGQKLAEEIEKKFGKHIMEKIYVSENSVTYKNLDNTLYTSDLQTLIAIAVKHKATFWIPDTEETTITLRFDRIGTTKQPILANIEELKPKISETKSEPIEKTETSVFKVFPNPDGKTYELGIQDDKTSCFDHTHLWLIVDGVPKGYWHLRSDGGADFFPSLASSQIKKLQTSKPKETAVPVSGEFRTFYGENIELKIYGDPYSSHDHLYLFKDGKSVGYFHIDDATGKSSFHAPREPESIKTLKLWD